MLVEVAASRGKTKVVEVRVVEVRVVGGSRWLAARTPSQSFMFPMTMEDGATSLTAC